MAGPGERLQRLIEAVGPIPVAEYMAEANAHYYGSRDPFGAAGDFTTAPEISQMFGELVGVWLADLWTRSRRPEGAAYVELGPGRGTLAADALRAMGKAGLEPAVHLVETSPVLRRAQAERVPHAHWHSDVSTLPDQRPLMVVANEFFDALPARQLVATGSGWRERVVTMEEGGFRPIPGPLVSDETIPAPLRSAPAGTIFEVSPAAAAIAGQLARRIATQGGAALIVDYGHDRSGTGDTLQAVSRQAYADPWAEPGERDLTVHVDFQALAQAAAGEGVSVHGPVALGEWLVSLGIDARAAALSRDPAGAQRVAQERERLVSPQQMGTLFRVLALAAPGWPDPEGLR